MKKLFLIGCVTLLLVGCHHRQSGYYDRPESMQRAGYSDEQYDTRRPMYNQDSEYYQDDQNTDRQYNNDRRYDGRGRQYNDRSYRGRHMDSWSQTDHNAPMNHDMPMHGRRYNSYKHY